MNPIETIERYKQFKIPSLYRIFEKARQYSKTCLLIVIFFVVLLVLALQYIPHWQVAQFELSNSTEVANLENQYRATLAQILGGTAVGIGIYFAWGNLTTAREGQITERFTRAVDQLGAVDHFGTPALNIRLGGIYALGRIENESEKDYWSIMEILTSYIRENSPIKDHNIKDEDVENVENQNKVSFDIQAILTVIGKRKHGIEESKLIDLGRQFKHLDLSHTYLNGANFERAHFEGTFFTMSHLKGANFINSNLEGAHFGEATINDAFFIGAHIEGTYFEEAHLKGTLFNGAHFAWTIFDGAHLEEAHFEGTNVSSAIFNGAHLEGAHFEDANFEKVPLILTTPKGKSAQVAGKLHIFEGAYLERANFEGAKNLTIDQLSKAKTLYHAKLDPELEKPLREKYPHIFEEPKDGS